MGDRVARGTGCSLLSGLWLEDIIRIRSFFLLRFLLLIKIYMVSCHLLIGRRKYGNRCNEERVWRDEVVENRAVTRWALGVATADSTVSRPKRKRAEHTRKEKKTHTLETDPHG